MPPGASSASPTAAPFSGLLPLQSEFLAANSHDPRAAPRQRRFRDGPRARRLCPRGRFASSKKDALPRVTTELFRAVTDYRNSPAGQAIRRRLRGCTRRSLVAVSRTFRWNAALARAPDGSTGNAVSGRRRLASQASLILEPRGLCRQNDCRRARVVDPASRHFPGNLSSLAHHHT